MPAKATLAIRIGERKRRSTVRIYRPFPSCPRRLPVAASRGRIIGPNSRLRGNPVRATRRTTLSGVTSNEITAVVPEPPRYPAGVREAGAGLRLLAYLLEGVLVLITLLIGWLIWAAIISGSGQTPAKQLLKLRVIDAQDSRPLGFLRMFFMRGIVAGIVGSLAISVTFGIIVLMPLWTKRKQNIWDFLSGSVVVVDSNNAWNL